MKNKIIPVGERVLVKPFTEQDLKKGEGKKKLNDFILPDSVAKEKSARGKVLSVGEGKKVRIGDIVVFSKYSYDEIEIDGEELYLIKEENILAVIKNG